MSKANALAPIAPIKSARLELPRKRCSLGSSSGGGYRQQRRSNLLTVNQDWYTRLKLIGCHDSSVWKGPKPAMT